jgi:hypothetical protein
VLAEIRHLRAELDELRAELLAATKKNAPDTGSSDAPG